MIIALNYYKYNSSYYSKVVNSYHMAFPIILYTYTVTLLTYTRLKRT